MLQDVRKSYDKTGTFDPPDNIDELHKKMKDSAEETLALTNLLNLKRLDDPKETTYVYDSTNLNDVHNLINEIKIDITENDHIVDLGDNKYVCFRDLFNFLHDIKHSKINNFNRKEHYEEKLMNTQNKLANKKIKYSRNISFYMKYLNNLRSILFTNKK